MSTMLLNGEEFIPRKEVFYPHKYYHNHKGIWKTFNNGLIGHWVAKYKSGDLSALNEALKKGEEYYHKFAEELFRIRF